MKFNIFSLAIGVIVINVNLISGAKDPVLYCDLCRAIVAETRVAVGKLDKSLKIKITTGQSRLASDGTIRNKSTLVPKWFTREFLEDIYEDKGTVCKAISDDYVKWFSGKDHKQWRVGRIMDYVTGGMNTNVDLGFLQQGQGSAREVNEKDPADRTRSIRWFCENTIEEIEDEIFDLFMGKYGEEALATPTQKLCQEIAGWCGDDMSSELYPNMDADYLSLPAEKQKASSEKKQEL